MKWIYLIKAETENGEESYKIGITKRNPNIRKKELQTGNSCELNILFKFKTNVGNKVEKALHRTYNLDNLKGEWFYLTKEQVDNFLINCNKIENDFILLEKENSWYQKNI